MNKLTRKTTFLAGLAGLGLVTTGCKKSGRPDPFAEWMPKEAAGAFAGTWSGRLMIQTGSSMSLAGAPVAVEIKGDKATAFDGAKDHALTFAIATPCTADFVESKQEQSGEVKYTYTVEFAVVGGKLEVAEGSVGRRRGKAAVVCSNLSMDGITVVDDKGGCQTFTRRFGDEWEAQPGTCAWSSKDGKDVLTIGSGDRATTLIADGDVLRSMQFADSVRAADWTKTADLAAAKQLVGWEVQASDDARNKGPAGTAGDLATVANAVATFVDDKAAEAFSGKPATLTGYVTGTGVTSLPLYYVEIVDAQGLRSPWASCYSKAPMTAGRWEKVTVTGTIAGRGGRVNLDECTATKAP